MDVQASYHTLTLLLPDGGFFVKHLRPSSSPSPCAVDPGTLTLFHGCGLKLNLCNGDPRPANLFDATKKVAKLGR